MDFLVSKKMKIFVTLMETGCFNHAVNRLFITRTPLTRALSDLEEQLGNVLFIRKNGKLHPTPFACDLFSKVLPHYKYLENLENSFNPNLKRIKIKIIVDDTYPDIMKDMLLSMFRLNDLRVSVTVEHIDLKFLNNMYLNTNEIMISAKGYNFPEEQVQKMILNESDVILIMSENIFNNGTPDLSTLKNTPVLLRNSAKLFDMTPLYNFFNNQFNVQDPIFDFGNLTLLESLHVMKSGKAMLILPVYICDMLGIDKSYSFPLKKITISTFAYLPRETGNAIKIKKIIKEITDMFR